jgi:hypothetical protein
MAASPDVRRAIAGAMVGFSYGFVVAFLSWFLYGGGADYGTSIPLLLSSAPLGVLLPLGKLAGAPYAGYGYATTLLGAPVMWAAFGSLVALSNRGRTLRLAQILLLLHYVSGIALVATTGEVPARLQRKLQISPEIVMWATAYLAGQAALWSSMGAGAEARRAIVGAIAGLLYGVMLAVLSLGAVGGGHGTAAPLFLSSAPLGAFFLVAKLFNATGDVGNATFSTMFCGTPLIWAALGSLVALSGGGMRLSVTRALLLLQYAAGLAFTLMALVADVPADLWSARELVGMWGTVYLIGQAALWWRIRSRSHAA